MKKILVLTTSIEYGGAGKILTWLAKVLAANSFDVCFLTYRGSESTGEVFDCTNVRYQHFNWENEGGSMGTILKTSHMLHRFIKANKFDLAISFLSASHLRLRLACFGTKTKVLLSQRGDPYYTSSQRKPIALKLFGLFSYRLFCSADCFVFQTKQAQGFYPKSVQERSVVIHNPIHPLQRTAERERDHRIVTVSRLEVVHKRQEVLIEAFNELSLKHKDYCLEFIGDGPDEDMLKALASGNSNIHFCGKTNDVVSSIQNAAMFVLCSDHEGIPNALLEAMSLGVPCISTDCSPGGAAIIIDNKVNGLLVERHNAKQLKEAMEYYINHPDIAEQYGAKAVEVCDKFDENDIANQWVSYIAKVLQ